MTDGYIITYSNPDTDGVCSAIAYSIYLEKVMGKLFVPYFSGDISKETRYVLDNAGIQCDGYSEFNQDKKIIVVDTHNVTQLNYLSRYENIIEIIDHHPDGEKTKFGNALIDNRKIGAVASIIGEKILNKGLMTTQIAIMIGSAIVSNTLNFTVPATSVYDRNIYDGLQKYYKFTDAYIFDMLSKRDEFLSKTTLEILRNDVKVFEIGQKKIAISQIETMNSALVLKRKDLFSKINEIQKLESVDYFIVNIVDISNKKSFVLSSEEALYITKKIFNQDMKSIESFNRILQRKTDFIPQIYKLMEDIK